MGGHGRVTNGVKTEASSVLTQLSWEAPTQATGDRRHKQWWAISGRRVGNGGNTQGGAGNAVDETHLHRTQGMCCQTLAIFVDFDSPYFCFFALLARCRNFSDLCNVLTADYPRVPAGFIGNKNQGGVN